jgi:hypothetical protein
VPSPRGLPRAVAYAYPMSLRLRVVAVVLLAGVVVAAGVALSGVPIGGDQGPTAGLPSTGVGALPGTTDTPEPTFAPTPTPRPALGGTELYGFLPYWLMNDSMAGYLDSTPLSTLALFSVTSRRNGTIDSKPAGYRRITGPIGRRLIDDAHTRKTRVELVFSNFGADRNARFFGRVVPPPSSSPEPSFAGPPPTPSPATVPSPPPTPLPIETPPAVAPWHRTVGELAQLVTDLGVDGVNVDIELLDPADVAAYGDFLVALRAALVAANPDARLSVATEAGPRGIGNAVAATAAGVDRVFLMGYDYHWSGSQPGASAPIDRIDGLYTLRWSIDQYVEAGVPRDRILLGLPLYGMSWLLEVAQLSPPIVGRGAVWVPNRHLDQLLDPSFYPGFDALQSAEFFIAEDARGWHITYYDSPTTLRSKLALARDNGLAGGGFWAIGYERGVPGAIELMQDFRAGDVSRDEAPARP